MTELPQGRASELSGFGCRGKVLLGLGLGMAGVGLGSYGWARFTAVEPMPEPASLLLAAGGVLLAALVLLRATRRRGE